MSTSTPEQPQSGQDQPVTPDPTTAAPAASTPPSTPAAPPTAPAGNAPWAQDLNSIFQDEATRGQVDQYLREKIQPHTTQLEQQVAQSKDAMNLWQKLEQDPVDTYVAITQELYGPEAAQAVFSTIQQQMSAQQAAEQQGAPAQPPMSDPRLESVINYVESQQNQQFYDGELARVQQAHPDLNADLFHPFVAAAEGNFDAAYELYDSWTQQWNAAHAPADPAAPEAPNVMGSDTATTTAPPVEAKKQSLDAAINDFMAENRSNREAPPVV